uniref:Uncharacterized protein n=1 Tax=Meleagris gallopavo TaxID=9103 RepID=A0A803YC43_MELGA
VPFCVCNRTSARGSFITGMDCHYSVWGVLAFLSLALIFSLILNISHYMKKKQEGKQDCLCKGWNLRA